MCLAGFAFSGCTAVDATPANFSVKDAQIQDGLRTSVSLVSLVFPLEDGVKDIKVKNLITGNRIPSEFARLDSVMVITLQLSRNELSNPSIALNSNVRYKALLTPSHALETFEGCDLDGSTTVLRDHGAERTLEAGETTPVKEFSRLWVGNKFVRAARFAVVGDGEVKVSGGSAMPILDNSFVAVPSSGVKEILVSIVAR